MADPNEWDTKYLNELKKHYVYDVVNYMFRESDNKFSRPYSLLSLARLYDYNNENNYYGLKEIVEKARDLKFQGADNLIEYGLNSSYEAGLVEVEETNRKNYRLNPRFSQWVIKQSIVILTTIKKHQTKASHKSL
jgi:hypothetical protein